MTRIEAANDNIFVRRVAAVTTKNGIVIPDAAQDRPAEGIIECMGPKVLTAQLRALKLMAYQQELRICNDLNDGQIDVAVTAHEAYDAQTFEKGDHVVFGKFAGEELKVGEDTFVRIKPDEIFGKLLELPEPGNSFVMDPEAGTVEKVGNLTAERYLEDHPDVAGTVEVGEPAAVAVYGAHLGASRE